MTDADLLRSLRDCYDPILKRNIVDLGLIRSATLTRDDEAPGVGVPARYIAHITLTAPAADEAAVAQLQAQIENRLAGLPAISRTIVTLLPTPFPILR
ncbi:MAG TPA: iron-sulfur cluster assembly protein [Acidobacteriaceae bacterium]